MFILPPSIISAYVTLPDDSVEKNVEEVLNYSTYYSRNFWEEWENNEKIGKDNRFSEGDRNFVPPK